MKVSIDIIRGGRKFLLNLLEGVSIEKLNEIPEGFINNLAWNMAHMIANQQILLYLNSGEKPVLSKEFIDKYKTGTHPESFISEDEYQGFQKNLIFTIDQFENDSKTKMFGNYKTLELDSYPGVKIESIEDAAKFVSFHEGLHIGYAMALKRALKK
ncbi:MAG: DinB family protein [Ginsengibacter sp.]